VAAFFLRSLLDQIATCVFCRRFANKDHVLTSFANEHRRTKYPEHQRRGKTCEIPEEVRHESRDMILQKEIAMSCDFTPKSANSPLRSIPEGPWNDRGEFCERVETVV
jgi:hypothetical protein